MDSGRRNMDHVLVTLSKILKPVMFQRLDGLGSGFGLSLRLGVLLVLLALALLLNLLLDHDAAVGLLLVPDHPGVDHLGAVSDHLLDQALLHHSLSQMIYTRMIGDKEEDDKEAEGGVVVEKKGKGKKDKQDAKAQAKAEAAAEAV